MDNEKNHEKCCAHVNTGLDKTFSALKVVGKGVFKAGKGSSQKTEKIVR